MISKKVILELVSCLFKKDYNNDKINDIIEDRWKMDGLSRI